MPHEGYYVKFCEPVSGVPDAHGRSKGHSRPVRALAVSPEGKTIVTASEDTTLLVWGAF